MACIYDTAVARLGHLGHLVAKKLASLYQVIGELPSMSRTMVATVRDGLTAGGYGVVSTLWFVARPAQRINDREADDDSLPIYR